MGQSWISETSLWLILFPMVQIDIYRNSLINPSNSIIRIGTKHPKEILVHIFFCTMTAGKHSFQMGRSVNRTLYPECLGVNSTMVYRKGAKSFIPIVKTLEDCPVVLHSSLCPCSFSTLCQPKAHRKKFKLSPSIQRQRGAIREAKNQKAIS